MRPAISFPVFMPIPRNISGILSAWCFSRSSFMAICISTAHRTARLVVARLIAREHDHDRVAREFIDGAVVWTTICTIAAKQRFRTSRTTHAG
jgi:hypothetical protein